MAHEPAGKAHVTSGPHDAIDRAGGRSGLAQRLTMTAEIERACESLAASMMPEIAKSHPAGTLVAFSPELADYVTAESEIELIRKFEAKFGKHRLGWFDEVGRGRRRSDCGDR